MRSSKIVAILFSSVLASSSFASGAEHQHGSHSHNISEVGKPALAQKANKTVKVSLLDSMKFEFERPVEIKAGDIVRFVVTNKGAIDHEFSIGNEKEHEAHREMMKQMPNMVHTDGTTISVKPNETKEITWQFGKKGNVMFACNISSHFEAGMYSSATVK